MSFNPKQTLTIIYFHVFIIVLPLFVFHLNFFKVCLTMSHFLHVNPIKILLHLHVVLSVGIYILLIPL